MVLYQFALFVPLRFGDTLYVDTGSGWTETGADQDGSYLLFTVAGLEFRATLVQKQSTLPLIVTCAGAAAVVLLIAVLIVHKKKKRKKTAVK